MSHGIEGEIPHCSETESSALLSQFSNSAASAPLREHTDELIGGEMNQQQSHTEQNLSLRGLVEEDYYLQLQSRSERSSELIHADNAQFIEVFDSNSQLESSDVAFPERSIQQGDNLFRV